MDSYLKCLYDHVMECLLRCPRPDMAEYGLRAAEQGRAWEDLKQALSPEQIQLVEAYQAAQSRVFALEDEWLFQEAVALGKWMALKNLYS